MKNLHLAEIQKIIGKKIRTKSKIYKFICKITDKLYIDSSIYLFSRFYIHINSSKSNILL